jgi:hypothetical protein
VNRALSNSFQALSDGVPATVGVALASSGSVASLGDWQTGVAWSTIKVPLAIAALRAGCASTDLISASIAQSDNGAAEQLWSGLGEPGEAAQQVKAVINDPSTVVESQRIRPEYTAFGQTQWSLVRQAEFAARLPSIPDASPIIELMGNLCIEHRWGLAAKGFAAKGGWGPGVDDDYLVRQFAIVPTGSATVGVALAAETRDEETGVEVLNTLADWVVENLTELTKD